MVNKHLIVLLILLLSPIYGQAGKIYKHVDENGKVTFSQVPPKEEDGGEVDVEIVSVGEESMTRISEAYGSHYCGDIKLPANSSKYGSSSGSYARSIEHSLEGWRESLTRTSENMQRRSQNSLNRRKYSNSYSSRSTTEEQAQTRDVQRIRDLRCAINWAESKQHVVNDFKNQSAEEKQRLNAISQRLEQNLYETCGELPELDPSDSGNEYKRKQWYLCSSEIRSDMRKVDQSLRRLP